MGANGTDKTPTIETLVSLTVPDPGIYSPIGSLKSTSSIVSWDGRATKRARHQDDRRWHGFGDQGGMQ